jgi:Tfp pilus assembly protein PilE
VSATGKHGEAGLSLTELVVVSFVLVILTGLVYATFRYESQTYARQTSQNATQATLRIWAARIAQTMRGACFNPSDASPSSYTIGTATGHDFEFTTNAIPTSVGFKLDGTNLLSLAGASTWRVALQGVTSMTLGYYDAQGFSLDPTSSTFTASSVAEVEVTLTAQAASSGYPGVDAPVIAEHFRAALRNQC